MNEMASDMGFQVVSLLNYMLDYAGTALLRIPRGPQTAFDPPDDRILSPNLGLEVHDHVAKLLDNPSVDNPEITNPSIVTRNPCAGTFRVA